MVNHGIIDQFFKLLDSKDEELINQALWCLGNIGGEGVDLRDALIEKGIVEKVLAFLDKV